MWCILETGDQSILWELVTLILEGGLLHKPSMHLHGHQWWLFGDRFRNKNSPIQYSFELLVHKRIQCHKPNSNLPTRCNIPRCVGISGRPDLAMAIVPALRLRLLHIPLRFVDPHHKSQGRLDFDMEKRATRDNLLCQRALVLLWPINMRVWGSVLLHNNPQLVHVPKPSLRGGTNNLGHSLTHRIRRGTII